MKPRENCLFARVAIALIVCLLINIRQCKAQDDTTPPNCPDGTYGSSCKFCHCTPQATCSKFNGYCSDGKCDPAWGSTACQVRLPQLRTSPSIANVSLYTVCICWTAWRNGIDIGSTDVVSYKIEQRINESIVTGQEWRFAKNFSLPISPSSSYCDCVPGLHPYSRYEFRVVPIWDDFGQNKSGLPTNSTSSVRPLDSYIGTNNSGIPIDIRVVGSSAGNARTLNVNWTPDSTGMTKDIELMYQPIGIGDCSDQVQGPSTTRILSASEGNFVIDNVLGWTKYFIVVTFRNEFGSRSSNTEYLSPEIAPTGAPTNLLSSFVTSNSAVLSWDDAPCAQRGGALINYEVEVRDSAGLIIRNVTTANTLTISGLQPFHSYIVGVRRRNGVSLGPEATNTFQTLVSSPSAPLNVQIWNVTNQSLFVTWQAPSQPNGVIVEYQVIYWKNETQGQKLTSLTTTPYIQLNGLSPYTQYNIQVRARSSVSGPDGWGGLSDTLTYTTLDGLPSAPLGLLMASRSDSCISIKWSEPASKNGVITMYKISHYLLSNPDGKQSQNVGYDSRTDTRCSLIAVSQYVFEVSASTRSGLFGPVSVVNIWTEVSKPPIPSIPLLVTVGFATVNMTLQTLPEFPYPPDTSYFVAVNDMMASSRKKRNVDKELDTNNDEEFDHFEYKYNISMPEFIINQIGYQNSEKINVDLDDKDSRSSPIKYPTYETIEGREEFIFGNLQNDERQPLGRKKRAIPDPVNALNLIGSYTAAEFTQSQLPGGSKSFLLGDDQIYGNYKNYPLLPNKNYIVYYVVANSWDGVTKMSYSQFPITTQVAPPGYTTGTPRPTGSTTTTSKLNGGESSSPIAKNDDFIKSTIVPIVVILGFLLLGCIAALLIWLCFKRKNKKSPPAYDRPVDLDTVKRIPANNNYSSMRNDPILSSDPGSKFSSDDIPVPAIGQHSDKRIAEEFKRLPINSDATASEGKQLRNNELNRTTSILAYDHSRVLLKTRTGSKYINANYIPDGLGVDRAYIAAQSPFNKVTIKRFWEMIVQENIQFIITFAGSETTAQYWPSSPGEEFQLKEVVVKILGTERFANFVVRTLEVVNFSARSRIVTQFCFTEWKDEDIPTCILEFLEFQAKASATIATAPNKNNAPILVHCSTGIERTAVYIAVDVSLKKANLENYVNVFNACSVMRMERMMMVPRPEYYRFIYEVLKEALSTNYKVFEEDLNFAYRLMLDTDQLTQKTYFAEQHTELVRYVNQNRGTRQANDPHVTGIHSYQQKNKFLLMPAAVTRNASSYWKMIYENHIDTIVLFEDDSLSALDQQILNRGSQHAVFSFKSVDVSDMDFGGSRTFNMTNIETGKTRSIKLFYYSEWKLDQLLPSRDMFVRLIMAVDEWESRKDKSRADSMTSIQCADGFTQSGLLTVCSVICEKMRVDGRVNIFHTVKSIKMRKENVIPTVDQYQFCFKVLGKYLKAQKRFEKRGTVDA